MGRTFSPSHPGGPGRLATRVARLAAPVAVGAAALAFAGWAISLAVGHAKFPLWGPAHAVGVLCIVFGLAVWVRHPEAKRIGWLLVAVGASWYFADLQIGTGPAIFRLGFWLADLNIALFAHLLFADPDGRLSRRSEKWLVTGVYATTLVSQGMRALSEHPLPPQFWGSPRAQVSQWAKLGGGLGLALAAIGIVLVVRRWQREPLPSRRARRPAWAASAVLAAVLAVSLLAGLTRASTHVTGVLVLCYTAALLLLGLALLLGVLRGTVGNWQSLELLLERTRQGAGASAVGHSPQDVLQDALRDALDDPTLALHLWSRKTREYLDASGEPAMLPTPDSGQEVTTVKGADRVPLAALAHDPCLNERPELRRRLNMVLDVATLALENARLDAETKALPRRLLDLERDIREQLQEMLHDRVQHRLTGIQLLLGQARKYVGDERQRTDLHDRMQHRLSAIQGLFGQGRKHVGDEMQLADLLAQMATELQDAVDELREVTKDIFPMTLQERGLRAVLASRFHCPPVPMVMLVEDSRWSPQVEMTAYLTITEAAGNSWRHARASKITVRAESAGNDLLVEVSDDGVGGATPHGEGTGLRRVRDRVMAHGGTFSLDSPPGQGTTIRASLPPA